MARKIIQIAAMPMASGLNPKTQKVSTHSSCLFALCDDAEVFCFHDGKWEVMPAIPKGEINEDREPPPPKSNLMKISGAI